MDGDSEYSQVSPKKIQIKLKVSFDLERKNFNQTENLKSVLAGLNEEIG
jgi:hypothetical protein